MTHLVPAIYSVAARAISISAIALFSINLAAQTAPNVQIEGAWVRTTVEGQKGTGGFMKLTAKTDMTLVGVASPVAGVGEVHEMSMDAGVMKMRALPQGIDLPAGKTVELKPGGYHVMLLDLKKALPKDSQIPVTLLFKDKAGKETKLELKMPVAARAPGSTDRVPAQTEHGAHKH